MTETTKHHQLGSKRSDQRMYGKPVEIYKFYLSKMNKSCERLFQHPMKPWMLDGETWYRNEPVGKTYLGNIMQRISKKAGISQEYTCHSVRASTITTLFQGDISAQGICSITKHRIESSLKHYIADISDEQKRTCSSGLQCSRHSIQPRVGMYYIIICQNSISFYH